MIISDYTTGSLLNKRCTCIELFMGYHETKVCLFRQICEGRIFVKRLFPFVTAVFLAVLMAGCSSSNGQHKTDVGNADWAYTFVVWEGDSYKVTEDNVKADNIGNKIGEVTKYSDDEIDATRKENFSNEYEEGTGYYEINDTKASVAIAVEVNDEEFVRAEKDDGE